MNIEDAIILWISSAITTSTLILAYFNPHPFLFLMLAFALTFYMDVLYKIYKG